MYVTGNCVEYVQVKSEKIYISIMLIKQVGKWGKSSANSPHISQKFERTNGKPKNLWKDYAILCKLLAIVFTNVQTRR